MMKKLLLSSICFFAIFSFAARSMSQQWQLSHLLQLTQAGASLELDLRNGNYTASELIRLAGSLKNGASLTLIIGNRQILSVSQCLKIAQTKPGQIIFRF